MSAHDTTIEHVKGGVRAVCTCGWFAFKIAHRPGHTETDDFEAARKAANVAADRHRDRMLR